MRKTATFLLATIASTQIAAAPAPPSWLVGLWQFGENAVWVRVNPDGSALQCRIAPHGTVYKSSGTFVSPGSIRWETMWETDDVSPAGSQLVIHGKGGDGSLHRTGLEMSPACFAKRSGIESGEHRIWTDRGHRKPRLARIAD